MNSIFIGNGLNRVSYGNKWQELVYAIGKDSNCLIPNTVQFNAKAIKQSGYKTKSKNTLKEIEKDLKTHIINEKLKDKDKREFLNMYDVHIVDINTDLLAYIVAVNRMIIRA